MPNKSPQPAHGVTGLFDTHYIGILEKIKIKIREAQLKAALSVNHQLLLLYWEIGNTIVQQESAQGWGAKVVELLSADLRKEFPGIKGFSPRNLRYMREFASVPEFTILQQAAANYLGFTIAFLIDKVKEANIREFYITKCVENGWSRNVLQMQIENQLHSRMGQAVTNFADLLPEIQSDLAIQIFKNPYVFNFLSMDEKMKERELEKALLQNITKFLLELGAGFAFVGQQVPLDVGEDEFSPI